MGGKSYPAEFRRRVLKLVEAGRRVAEVATNLGISQQTIYDWRRQDRIDRGLESGISSAAQRIADKQDFYQLLTYKDHVDLEAKLEEWENFYNYHRPHGAFRGGTPYEALREKLRSNKLKVSHAT